MEHLLQQSLQIQQVRAQIVLPQMGLVHGSQDILQEQLFAQPPIPQAPGQQMPVDFQDPVMVSHQMAQVPS
jgi:hypothetical protein